MLIPARSVANLTESDVQAIIVNRIIKFDALDTIIPKGTPNTWNAQPTDRIQYGFKYEWNQNEANDKIVNWHVHGHAPDPSAPAASNASNGWVVRIKRKNRWLLDAPYTPQAPGNPGPQHWASSRGAAARSHIAVATNQPIDGSKSYEAPAAATRILGTNIPIGQGVTRPRANSM